MSKSSLKHVKLLLNITPPRFMCDQYPDDIENATMCGIFDQIPGYEVISMPNLLNIEDNDWKLDDTEGRITHRLEIVATQEYVIITARFSKNPLKIPAKSFVFVFKLSKSMEFQFALTWPHLELDIRTYYHPDKFIRIHTYSKDWWYKTPIEDPLFMNLRTHQIMYPLDGDFTFRRLQTPCITIHDDNIYLLIRDEGTECRPKLSKIWEDDPDCPVQLHRIDLQCDKKSNFKSVKKDMIEFGKNDQNFMHGCLQGVHIMTRSTQVQTLLLSWDLSEQDPKSWREVSSRDITLTTPNLQCIVLDSIGIIVPHFPTPMAWTVYDPVSLSLLYSIAHPFKFPQIGISRLTRSWFLPSPMGGGSLFGLLNHQQKHTFFIKTLDENFMLTYPDDAILESGTKGYKYHFITEDHGDWCSRKMVYDSEGHPIEPYSIDPRVVIIHNQDYFYFIKKTNQSVVSVLTIKRRCFDVSFRFR